MSGKSSRSGSKSINSTRFGDAALWTLPSRPLLLWITDAIIVALVVVFPFIMGGREAWGHRTLISLSTLLGFVWGLHRFRTGGRFVLLAVEPLIVAGLLLVWFQTVPLTSDTLHRLSGEYQRLLPFWSETQIPASGQSAITEWSTASLYPTETQHALLMLISYGIIAVVVAQRLSTEEDCYLLLKLLGFSGVLMAVFATVQLLTSNDRFFWFYKQPYTGTKEILKGAFTNRNHFAQFLSLSIGPLLWWLLVGRKNTQPPVVLQRKGLGPAHGNHSQFDNVVDPKMLLLICAIGGVVLSVMLTLSRGGMIAAAVVSAITFAGLWKSGRVNSSLAVVLVALGVIAIGGLLVFGSDRIEDRVGQLVSADADQIDRSSARRTIWTADFLAMKAFPIVGTGVGSHRYVYPTYMEKLADFSDISFSHAESSFVNLGLETGGVGLGLLGLGLLYMISRLMWHIARRTEPERVAALAAVLAGLLGGVVHATVDFIWYVPAIVVITIILGVIGLRLCSGFHPQQGLFMPRIAWIAGGLICLGVLCRSQPELASRVAGERFWYQYLIANFDERRMAEERRNSLAELDIDEDDDQELTDSQSDQSTIDPSGENIASYEDDAKSEVADGRLNSLRHQINLLKASLKANPRQALAALHLADKCREMFELLQQKAENPLPLIQVRDTVLVSKFSTAGDMHRFLKRAFGPPIRLVLLSDELCRRSLALCPLQDKAYDNLILTSFIRDPADRLHEDLISQTLLLGSNNPGTRYSIGQTLLLDGKPAEALKHWSVVFHSNKQMRLAICSRLGSRYAVDIVLTEFQPTVDELQEVLTAYALFQRKQDIEKLLYVVAEKTRQSLAVDTSGGDPERHRSLLMQSYLAAYELKLFDKCEELLQLAIVCAPTAETPHRALGLLMFEQKRFEEAEEQFAWCYDQLPGDTRLEQLLRDCRHRIANESSTRARSASYRR